MTFPKTIVRSAVLSLLALAPSSNAVAQERPDLSGSWSLNVEESDDMREQVPWNEADPPQAGARRPVARGGRRPGAGGGFGRGGGRLDPERVEQTMQLARQGARHLTIAQTDSLVTITYRDGSVLVLPTNGQKRKVKVDDGGDIEIKARWKNDDFVVERKVSGGGKVTETYLRPPDRNQMYVIIEIEIGSVSRAFAFRRVYDLEAASQF